MVTGEKILRKQLEKENWILIGDVGGLLIFARKNERMLWDPEKEVVVVAYKVKRMVSA